MSPHLRELAARREALVARAASERAVMREAMRGIRRGLAVADGALAIVDRIRRRPLVAGVAAAAVALVLASPRRALKWLGYGLSVYSLVRRLRRIFAKPAA